MCLSLYDNVVYNIMIHMHIFIENCFFILHMIIFYIIYICTYSYHIHMIMLNIHMQKNKQLSIVNCALYMFFIKEQNRTA